MHEYVIVEIDKIKPSDNNARVHSSKQVKQIMGSMKEFGFTNPLIIDTEYNLIAGHGRLEALKQLNKIDFKDKPILQVPCIQVKDLSDTQKRALCLADNQIALNSTWDNEKLQFHITRGERKHWNMFKEFHYLSHSFNKSCNNIFLLHFKSHVIGFCAFLNMLNPKRKFMRVHRIVIHPDFQGLNLGTLFLKECCQLIKEKYKGFHIILNTGLKSFAFALKKDKDFICYYNSYSSLNKGRPQLNKSIKIKYISFKYIGK